jgi:hypothetical protein
VKRLKVKNDFIFQKIFGQNEHREILIGFLNAVLQLEATERLTEIEILENTKLRKDTIDDKLGILDIRAKTAAGEQINIEIQLVNQYNMDQRTLFYWSKLFTEQLKEGPSRRCRRRSPLIFWISTIPALTPIIPFFIYGKTLTRTIGSPMFWRFTFWNSRKFRKAKPDLSKPLDRWLIFIEDSPEEVREMAMNVDPNIAKAAEILERLGSLDEVRRYYEAREMAIHDEVTRITGAKAEGLAEGIATGRAEGLVEGKLETARNMLREGINVPLVVKVTGLPEADVAKLQVEIAGVNQ